VSAAKPERKLAICQPENSAALMAAPPVEKSSAAPTNCRRAVAEGDMAEK
jgi:hypothetical protein